MILRIILLLGIGCWRLGSSAQCYSCSSPQLHLKWPKDENTNRLLYLQEFPWFANESCETVRDLMPVVDCEDSVCIKAVIKQPPAERTICETGGAIVRDCWSRVFSNAVKNPRARRDVVRLAQTSDSEETIGIIYTCEGFLCNSSRTVFSALSSFITLFLWLLLIRQN
ncbi:hypothetical protein L5515_005979 [Caenorhabditis briggsae]|uniref:Protein quiver n=1 Tax=Caenorhabditis briggsae TaxID=6238 RepID=A0AAE9A3K6_CAEBR|nr:hypothetical protein L3Y34_006149 [Caenorhabditis briggsae]UMM32029.1 hypothetical protein L5515_005979 [Caenorhabditis briggsae]